MMEQQSSSTHINNGDTQTQTQLSNVFHDFMGMKSTTDSPALLPSKSSDPSDLASSERQVRGHLEGVPFYGPRNDISGPGSSSKLTGYKRSNSDSAFMVSSRDGVRQLGPDSLESSHLMKILRNGAGGEQTRRFGDEEALFGTHIMRPTSSLLLQHPAGSRIDANMSANPYPPRGVQFSPMTHKVPQHKFRDSNVISPSAADEGSRTGMKGSGIFSSVTGGNGTGATEQSKSRLHLSGSSNLKSVTQISVTESSTPPSRQMTIFYGGQAHVFDDVHPNKADVIMALARSNGGSWSTTYSPKSAMRMGSKTCRSGGENEAGIATNTTFSFQGRLSNASISSHGGGSSDRIGGGNQVQASERSSTDEKGEL